MAKITPKKTPVKKQPVKKPVPKKKAITRRATKTDKALMVKTDPGSLLQLAIEKNMDMEKLSQLLDIYERWEAGKAKKKYFEALAGFQSECPGIEKRKAGYNKRYFYAPLEDIVEQVKNLLQKYGFSYSFSQDQQSTGIIKITCHLHHKDGHTEIATLEAHADGSGGKNAIQSIASTVTYLRRYTFCGILGITTADTDDDGQSYEPVIKKKLKKVEDAIILKDENKEKNVWQKLMNIVMSEKDHEEKLNKIRECNSAKGNDEELMKLLKKYQGE